MHNAAGAILGQGEWFQPNEQIRLMFNFQNFNFLNAFPQCRVQTRNMILNTNFYIKKFYWQRVTSPPGQPGQIRKKTVHFVISKNQLPDTIHENQLLNYLHVDPNWISRAACKEGEITELKTRRPTRPAGTNIIWYQHYRRCGFASLMAYFCFLDRDHLHDATGYQIMDDDSINNPWLDGNMPNLRNGPAGFNNVGCKIIYVRYYLDDSPHLLERQREGIRGRKGNKAFIYAAKAAGYEQMVAYNPNPCQQECCESRGDMGTTFLIHDLLLGFNQWNASPRNHPPWKGNRIVEIDDFAEHFGNDWYFCNRDLEAFSRGSLLEAIESNI